MAIKGVQFETVGIGDRFTSNGYPYTKVADFKAALTAVNQAAASFKKFKKTDWVSIEVPDPPPPTPLEIAERRVEHLNRHIRTQLSSTEHTLLKFAEKLQEDPCYAFEWADRSMIAAAERWVALSVQAWMQPNEAEQADLETPAALKQAARMDRILDEVTKQVLRDAANPSHSTSMPSNLMAQYKTAAFAEFLEKMKYA